MYRKVCSADEGISGTSAEKLTEFQRLTSDCRKGKIDRIVVKSISRFARNTRDYIKAIRELKTLGVSVYIAKENINTGKTVLFTAVFDDNESADNSGAAIPI